jgi:HK97 family phage portal protein
MTLSELASQMGSVTTSGEVVTPENSKSIATAYRAGNIISDDVAKMPLQQFMRVDRDIRRIEPDPWMRNIPYLLEISPNLWGWTPFHFKKCFMQWLIYWGNGLIWRPAKRPAELFVLPTKRTRLVRDEDRNLWYEHRFVSGGAPEYIPAVEVMHVMINPDESGFWGRGVVTFARETFGKQLAAYKTQGKLFAQGMTPSAVIQMGTKLDKEGRKRVRDAYEESMSGVDNAYRLAVMDTAVVKFEPVQMKLADAQFLQQINATDLDVANFFGMSLHMLNMGKQAYNSNDQKFGEYLQGTLDAYLVPIEQGGRVRWLPIEEQVRSYFKFNRESLLRMDPKARADMNKTLIDSGQRNPNEAREKDDMSAYPDGDKYWMTKNNGPIGDIPNENQ